MRLPNRDNAIMPEDHPVGRFKAAFFARLGYTRDDWQHLEGDLRAQHLSLDAHEGEPTVYGRKFTISGPLTGPSGDAAGLVSVWVIRRGEDLPRFLTAYPRT